MAGDLGVDVDEVRRMESRLTAGDVGFDAGVDDEEDGYVAPAYYLEDNAGNPALLLENADWEASSNQNLQVALEQLDERSLDIIRARWLSDSKATLHDLADKYGVSAERVRQLEKNAMKKVRATMEA